MKDFWTIFTYTFWENARKKVFIYSTLITLIIVVGLLLVPSFMNRYKSPPPPGSQTTATTVYLADPLNLAADELAASPSLKDRFTFERISATELEASKTRVKEEENSLLLMIDQQNEAPLLTYYVSQMNAEANADIITRGVKAIYLEKTLRAANVSPELAGRLMKDIPYSVHQLGGAQAKQPGNMISAMLIMLVLFFAIYFYGYGVAMSIASEKTSRVMELLITSTSPSAIVLGKSCAMGILGVSQLALLIAAAVATYRLAFPPDFTLGGMAISFAGFTPLTVIVIFAYFLLGYGLYAMLNAVVGATVSKAEDLNSALMPVSLITLLAFYASYFTIMAPEGTLSRAVTFIPFTSPFSVPVRFLSIPMANWELGVSLLILLLSVILVGWLSVRLYSVAVLHYGQRLKLKDLIRMAGQ